MGVSITAGGVRLPSPVQMTVSDEIIWSADTGRAASGQMLGDVVAAKNTVVIRWGVITAAELTAIRTGLTTGFYPVTITVDDTAVTMNYYRGALTSEVLGTHGGVTYYNNVQTTIIQQ